MFPGAIFKVQYFVQELTDLASKSKKGLAEVALGQGQADTALDRLREAMASGSWVVLKNLHLMTSWVPVLAKEVAGGSPHPDFRLWLTAEPHPRFPALLSEMCLKVTYEAPPGIKKNLQSTLGSWAPDFLSRGNNPVRSQTIFTAAWFHAVIQERRTYIPQGWANYYEFSDGDLRAGLEVIETLFREADNNVSWDFIHGLFINAIYGGRVDNMYDLRILASYLTSYFNSNVLAGANRSRAPLGPGLELPATTSMQEYMDLVSKLPEEDKPSFFGLPANIERSHQRNVSTKVLNQLKQLRLSSEVAARFDRERWTAELSPILALWKKLNQGTGLLQQKLTQPQVDGVSPIKGFVMQESHNGVALLQDLHKSLAGLSKVIRGTALLDGKVTKLAGSLLQGSTPASWQAKWLGPEEPMDYIRTVVHKANEARKWVSKADSGAILKESLDLADLFHPDTFLSALAQQSAREHGVSMSSLQLASSWSRSGVSGARTSIKVSGLQIEGATFDGSRLTENSHDSPSFQAAPVCTLAWVPDQGHQSDNLSVPLYWTRERDRLLAMLEVPSGRVEETWLQAGLVLTLSAVS